MMIKIKGSMVWFFFSETSLAWTLDAHMLCVHVAHVCFGVSGVSLLGCVEVSSYKDANSIGLGFHWFVYLINDIIATYDLTLSYRALNV